jgi:hypothetical protein
MMIITLEARFDGTVLHPNEPLALEPNSRVLMTIETIPFTKDAEYTFLDTAASLNLDGPPDWSTNLDAYLYGEESKHDK